jgi:hypothetical protein
MTRLHTHVLNIPWIMDDVFLCSPVPNEQFTNFPFRRGVCTWIHHALGMGSLAKARTALGSERRTASPARPLHLDYGPRAAVSAYLTQAQRRTGSRGGGWSRDGCSVD